jgi:hypothetical protein
MLHQRTKAALEQLLADATAKGEKARARRLQSRLDEVMAYERENAWIVA